MTNSPWITRSGLLLTSALVVALVVVHPITAADKKTSETTSAKVAKSDLSFSKKIDQAVQKKLDTSKVPASPRADDAEFLRRAYLDLLGVVPSAEQAASFIDSKDADKRTKLIDELLENPLFGTHLADIWQALLLPRNSDNRRLQAAPMVAWLAKEFNANTPWDKFVHKLLTASGAQSDNGAVTYFLANNSVDKITDNVTKHFLGVQLQCAQCHNHPFTGWKQNEYWGMAAFFMNVRIDNVNKAAKMGDSPGITEVVARGAAAKGKQRLPESAKIVPAKFLQAEEPKMKANEAYRPIVADWITSAKNPYFARATVNRLWAQYFGRGLVNPIDDLHDANLASHPELLKELSAGFIARGFDLKQLVRVMCNSETYQRTSKPVKGNEDAEAALYSRMAVKVMSPEQLYDSLTRVLGSARGAAERPAKGQNANAVGPRAAFVAFFNIEDGSDPTEYQAGIPQALRLMNSAQFNNTALVTTMLKENKKPQQIIEQLFLTTLARRPTTKEMDRFTAVATKGDARQAYADLLWVLVNCSEFTMNH